MDHISGQQPSLNSRLPGLDTQSATWQAVREWAEDEVVKAKDALAFCNFENLNQVADVQGSIRALMNLLNLEIKEQPRAEL